MSRWRADELTDVVAGCVDGSTSVLPLELRPYAHLYATPAGYPYYDPRQLVS